MARRVTPWNPNTAYWLLAQRGERKQDDIVAALAERGVKISREWLSRIENGAPFGARLLEAFQDLYGSVPPPYVAPEPAGAAATPDDLIGALTRNAIATERLVGLLTPLIGVEADGVKARLEELEALVRALTEPVLGGGGAPRLPQEKAQ